MDVAAGAKRQVPGYRYESGDYEMWQVICVHSGAVALTVRETVMRLHTGEGCLLPVGSAFSLHCDRQGYTGVYGIRHDLAAPPEPMDACAFIVPPELRTLGALIETEAARAGRDTESVLVGLGAAILHMAIRHVESRATRPARTPRDWVERTRPVIERSVLAGEQIETALAGVGLSYRQLSRHYRSVLGMTPKQYQMQHRIALAQRMLAETSVSITSIAYELGFASSQHFSGQFAMLLGSSPRAYRRREVGAAGAV